MPFLEKFWFLLTLLIIFLILLTDTKSPTSGSWDNKVTSIFTTASEGQKFLTTLIWVLIITLFILSLLLSFFSF